MPHAFIRPAAALAATALFLAACASAPSSQVYYGPPPKAASGPKPATSQLVVCSGMRGDRAGPIARGGEVMAFSPIIDIRGRTLWRNPTDGGCLTSGYGWRRLGGSASGGSGRMHHGIDLGRPSTRAIFAAGAGRVMQSGWAGGYGNRILIDHGRGVETLYAHLADGPLPAVGSRVDQGERIGWMGSTGRSTGLHLHYEVKVDGKAVDPLRVGLPQPVQQFFN